jgi:hypothetical protein
MPTRTLCKGMIWRLLPALPLPGSHTGQYMKPW